MLITFGPEADAHRMLCLNGQPAKALEIPGGASGLPKLVVERDPMEQRRRRALARPSCGRGPWRRESRPL